MRFAWTLCAVASFVGCAAPPIPVQHQGLEKERFTKVNLRPEGKNLYSSNFLSLTSAIPIGTPVKLTFYSAQEARIVANEVEYTLHPSKSSTFDSVTLPTDDAGVDAFLKKYFADSKDELKTDSLGPPELNEKMKSGFEMIGMTKEQVYACLGPPILVGDGIPVLTLPYEKILESDHWVYPESWIVLMPTYIELYFGDGRLQKRVP